MNSSQIILNIIKSALVQCPQRWYAYEAKEYWVLHWPRGHVSFLPCDCGLLGPSNTLVPAACPTKCASESLSVLQINAWRFQSDIRILGDNNNILSIKCVTVNVYRFQFKIQDGELGIDTKPKRHQSNSLQSVQWTFPDLKKKHAAIGNIMASWTTIDTQFQSCSRSRFKSFEKSDWLSLSHIYKHSVHQWIYNSPTLLNTLGGWVQDSLK